MSSKSPLKTGNIYFYLKKISGVNPSTGSSMDTSTSETLAQIEEERREHKLKMKKMEREMELSQYRLQRFFQE